jgi:hypothetical protein
MWHQIGNRPPPARDHDGLPRLNQAKDVGGPIPQLSASDFYDSATNVALAISPILDSAFLDADRLAWMILYTCGTKKMGPGFAHPCAKAGKALDAAGYEYELKTVGGYRLMPWTWGSREQDRAEIKKLSGTPEVPILVLDDGQVISGSGAIASWAKEHPHSPAKSGS